MVPCLLAGITADFALPPPLPSCSPDRKGVFSGKLPGAGLGLGQERPRLGRKECREVAFRGGGETAEWVQVSEQSSGGHPESPSSDCPQLTACGRTEALKTAPLELGGTEYKRLYSGDYRTCTVSPSGPYVH